MSELETGTAEAAPVGNAEASTPTPVTVVETPTPSIADTMAEAYDRLNPPRDEKTQQFVSKDKPAVEETPAEPETQGEPQSTETVEQAKPAITYPNSLPAALRDKFGTAAPEVVEWINQREAESHKRITELGQTAKAHEQFQQVAERYKGSFQGRSAVKAFEQLAAASEYLERDPVGALQWLANSYRVDLSKLATTEAPGTDQNPEVAQLRQTIGHLQRQIAETSNRVQSREEAERQTNLKSIEQRVEDFAKDKPYWGELEADIVAQIHALRSTETNLADDQLLQKAYDRALKLSEGVQAKIQADQKAEAEKKAKAEAAKKAADAKKAASVNVKSTQGGSPKATGSWEETMREIGNRLMG